MIKPFKSQIESRACVTELEAIRRSLEAENKVLAKQAEKALKAVKDTMPTKEHEESVAHYRYLSTQAMLCATSHKLRSF
jgi:hypothetical protein